MPHPPKAEGFAGQRIVVLPRDVIARAHQHPLLRQLFPTDAGFFPRAAGHTRTRREGVDQAILIFCAKGAGWCDLGGRRHPIGAGEMLVVPPGQPHAYGADEEQPWTIPWVHATGLSVPHFLAELGVGLEHPVVYLGEEPRVRLLLEEVLEVLEQGYAPANLIHAAQALGHLLGTMIWRQGRHWRGEPDPGQRVSATIAYMKQHLERTLTVNGLAALANLSPTHYSALFKRATGYSPIDYFIRLRMHHACQLLDTTTLTIKELARQIGYEDPLYFSRVFRQVNEISPTDYRLTHKG